MPCFAPPNARIQRRGPPRPLQCLVGRLRQRLSSIRSLQAARRATCRLDRASHHPPSPAPCRLYAPRRRSQAAPRCGAQQMTPRGSMVWVVAVNVLQARLQGFVLPHARLGVGRHRLGWHLAQDGAGTVVDATVGQAFRQCLARLPLFGSTARHRLCVSWSRWPCLGLPMHGRPTV